jgi:hypothetical protein
MYLCQTYTVQFPSDRRIAILNLAENVRYVISGTDAEFFRGNAFRQKRLQNRATQVFRNISMLR